MTFQKIATCSKFPGGGELAFAGGNFPLETCLAETLILRIYVVVLLTTLASVMGLF